MTKLNPDRVRRHRARSIPDRVELRFDWVTEEAYVYRSWLERFGKNMVVKHGPNVEITLYRDDQMGRHPGETLFIATAR